MAIDHEAPYSALATRLQTYCGGSLARPVARRLVSFDQLGAMEQPSMFCVAAEQEPTSQGPEACYWTLTAEVYICARADTDPNLTAEPMLNFLIGKVEAALERQADESTFGAGPLIQNWTTLGGAVIWAKPSAVASTPGGEGHEGMAIVRVEMLVAPAPTKP